MAKTGVFIGRFQPFHDGHKACIKKILETCTYCLILLRYGVINENNPHTVSERLTMISDWAKQEGLQGRVQIQPIQDPDYNMTVFYGRKVGYGIEELRLSPDIEAISATKIRDDNVDIRS